MQIKTARVSEVQKRLSSFWHWVLDTNGIVCISTQGEGGSVVLLSEERYNALTAAKEELERIGASTPPTTGRKKAQRGKADTDTNSGTADGSEAGADPTAWQGVGATTQTPPADEEPGEEKDETDTIPF